MSLVGEKSRKSASENEQKTNKAEKSVNTEKTGKSPVKMFNPALLPIEEELRFAQRKPYEADAPERAKPDEDKEDNKQAYIKNQNNPSEQAERSDGKSGEKAELSKEAATEKRKDAITAIVLELINQELDAIVKRFHIAPTDSNLWQLTKAALEAVRPEFSLNGEDYEEKCGRLRQKVILEMTKAAIGISKTNRK